MLKLDCKLAKSNSALKSSQGLIEYVMVFIMVVVVMYAFATRFDFSALKKFAIYGIFKQGEPNKVILPPMTD